MFSFASTHADTGSGSATEDEIVRDTSRAAGQIMAAARAFIHSRIGRPSKAKAPKLSRKDRRDLAEALRAQVGEQKIAEAWYTKRVNDYHSEVVAAQIRRDQPGYTRGEVDNDQDRLAGIRYQIESTLHEQQSLPMEQRGQVAMALSAADRNPEQRYGAIFRPMDAEQARIARSVAVQSETWVAGRREDNVRLVAEQRAQAAKLAEARREARPARDYEELTRSQRQAVQLMRATHLGVDRTGKQIPAAHIEAEQERSKAVARDRGLTKKEIGEELAYMAENTNYMAEYGDAESSTRSYYPFREQAVTEMRKEMAADRSLSKNDVFASVQSRPDGLEGADPEVRRTFARDRADAVATVARWEREPGELQEYIGAAHEVAVARIEPGTGKVLHSEIATLGSEQAAVDFAHRGVTSAGPSVARMRVEITDPKHPETPIHHDYGLPSTLANRLSDVRVASRERLLDESEAAREGMSEEYMSLDQRHRLSIEHNSDLTARNGDLTRQLTTMIAERDQALADRDKFRGERDEAVQKVVAMTPPEKRFGSPERQADQARSKAAAPDRAQKDLNDLLATARGAGALDAMLKGIGVSAETRGRVAAAAYRTDLPATASSTGAERTAGDGPGRSALADYKSGNAITTAQERAEAEREGAER